MKTRNVAVLLALAAASAIPAGAQDATRNPKLRDLPDNTWVELCPLEWGAGASEVRWCFDTDRKRFVRVGGCTEKYSNEVYSFEIATEKWTCNLPFTMESGMKERPGHGCNRGICYDRKRKCVWVYGGATSYSPPGNTRGLWKGTGNLGKGEWEHIPAIGNMEQAAITVDPDTHRLIILGEAMGTGRIFVYDPDTGKLEKGPASPYDDGPDGRGVSLDFFPYLEYIPELKGCLYVSGPTRKIEKANPDAGMVTWLFDPKTLKWKDLAPKGAVPARRKHAGESYDSKNGIVLLYGGRGKEHYNDTWSYLPKENRWVELQPKASLPKAGSGMLMAYDPDHNVHVLGKLNWKSVWVYRYKGQGK